MVGISIKFLALGLGYFVALLFQLRVYVKPAAISVFPVFHVLVILLFAFRCFAFLLAVSYSDADGIKVVPHPEFEWALYDIGGVLGFAAYMSIAWHMMHVLKWHVARREARAIRGKYRRKRRPRASTSSSNGSGGRGSTGSGRPSGPASSASYGSLSTNAELVKMAPIMRGQLCKCNTVVFTSGTAVTASAALFVVSYLAMYAVVFLSYRHHTEDAIHLLHKRCIPIFFLSGASLVIFTLAVACVAFCWGLHNDRVSYPLYWCVCEFRVRRRTLLVMASCVGMAAMLAKMVIMVLSLTSDWYPFDVTDGNQVWYYPVVDSLPLFLCFELLRPLLRTVPSSTAAEEVLERMHAALELARMSSDGEDTDQDSVGSVVVAGLHDEDETSPEKLERAQTDGHKPTSPRPAAAAKLEEQMHQFQRNVAAFESLVLDNFRDVQAQLAHATATNRGNAQQLISLKQMTRIMARMVAVQADPRIASPKGGAAVADRGRGASETLLGGGGARRRRITVARRAQSSRTDMRGGSYRPPMLAPPRPATVSHDGGRAARGAGSGGGAPGGPSGPAGGGDRGTQGGAGSNTQRPRPPSALRQGAGHRRGPSDGSAGGSGRSIHVYSNSVQQQQQHNGRGAGDRVQPASARSHAPDEAGSSSSSRRAGHFTYGSPPPAASPTTNTPGVSLRPRRGTGASHAPATRSASARSSGSGSGSSSAGGQQQPAMSLRMSPVGGTARRGAASGERRSWSNKGDKAAISRIHSVNSSPGLPLPTREVVCE